MSFCCCSRDPDFKGYNVTAQSPVPDDEKEKIIFTQPGRDYGSTDRQVVQKVQHFELTDKLRTIIDTFRHGISVSIKEKSSERTLMASFSQSSSLPNDPLSSLRFENLTARSDGIRVFSLQIKFNPESQSEVTGKYSIIRNRLFSTNYPGEIVDLEEVLSDQGKLKGSLVRNKHGVSLVVDINVTPETDVGTGSMIGGFHKWVITPKKV